MNTTNLLKKKFKSAYFRELKRYTFDDIKTLLSLNIDECTILIKKLRFCGVLKIHDRSTENIDIEEISNSEYIPLEEDMQSSNVLYFFKFVGIITINNSIIISYPKYINSVTNPEEEVKQILKVLKKYNAEKQYINFYTGELGDENFNLLSLILYLIDDYINNHLYSRDKQIIELNGEGEIIWDKTINETYAYLVNRRPLYVEYFTKRHIDEDTNYFKRLHKAILSECFELLKNSKLNELFEICDIKFDNESIDELGDYEYLLYKLEQELRIQYVTQKQLMLKSMYAYISQRRANRIELGFSIYGSTSFNLVWEAVCGKVLDNKLNIKLKNLPLKLSKEYESERHKTLLEIIEKPLWKSYENGSVINAKKSLTPDLLTISEMYGEIGISIFDAKYYCISYGNNSINGQPGVGDITKQYLYQLSYQDFITRNGYKFFINAFLVPTEGNEILNVGQVEMSILQQLSNSNMKNIEVINLPAIKMFDLYNNEKTLNIKELLDSNYEIISKDIVSSKKFTNENVY